MLPCGFEALFQANRRERGPIRRLRAFASGVLHPQVDGVHVELARQLVDGAFHGMHGLRRTRRAVGANLGLVDEDVVAFDEEVLEVIRREHRHAAGADRSAWESACLIGEPCARCGDGAVVLGADLHLAPGGRGGAGRAEDFLAGHHHLHRATGELAHLHRQRFEIDDGLAAEAAADLRRDHLDVAHGLAEHLRRQRAHLEVALGAAPDGGLAVLVRRRRAGVRFDVALMGGGNPMLALDDHVGGGETGLHVAALELGRGGDVAGRLAGVAVGVLALVDEGCAVGDGLVDGEHRRQRFVFHVDEIERVFGLLQRLRGNGCHGVAVVEHLVACEHVLGEVGCAFVGEVAAGNGGQHAVGGERPREVQALDASVGVRAAQHLAVEHARQVEVGTECRPASHLVDAVGTNGAGADGLEIFRFCHWLGLLDAVAVALGLAVG